MQLPTKQTSIQRLSVMFTVCAVTAFFMQAVTASALIPVHTTKIYHRIVAVENTMRFYIGWENTDRTKWKEPAKLAIDELDQIKQQLTHSPKNIEEEPLRQNLLQATQILTGLYTNIAGKDDEVITSELETYFEIMRKYAKDFKQISLPFYESSKLAPDAKRTNAGKTLLDSANDWKTYNTALRLLAENEAQKAYKLLVPMLDKYKGTPAQGIVTTVIVQCMETQNSEFEIENGALKSIELLENFFTQNIYCPDLDKMFLQWRTINQYWNYGASNWSQIPYDKYLLQRYKIAKIIESYISKHPDNKLAKHQLWNMLTLPIIERGGLLGNTNSFFWAELFAQE